VHEEEKEAEWGVVLNGFGAVVFTPELKTPPSITVVARNHLVLLHGKKIKSIT